MKISIITPTFNSSKTILDTLKSIAEQDFENFEHVITDGLSKDNTLDIIKNFYSEKPHINYRIISEGDNGISDAFNKGIKAATGDVIGFLNSDDYFLHQGVLSQINETFEKNDCDFVHGSIFFEDNDFGSNIRKPLGCDPIKAMPFNHPTLYAKKSVYEEVGLFDETFKCAMDYEWVLRLYDENRTLKYKGKLLEDPRPIVFMRAGGMSWKQELQGIDDTKSALKRYHFYTFEAKFNVFKRHMRVKIRNLLEQFGLTSVIKLWRRWKWQ